MPYKIILSEGAESQLKRLDRHSAIRIVRKLRLISGNPQRSLHRLEGREELKLRIGDYRLLIMMLHKENTLLVVAIGHRRDIYRKN